MQQLLTAKLKLTPTPEQLQALREIQLASRDALNAVSHYAFEQGKISNVTGFTKGCMPNCVPGITCPPNWPVASSVRWLPPTQDSGVRPDDARDLLLYESTASLRRSE